MHISAVFTDSLLASELPILLCVSKALHTYIAPSVRITALHTYIAPSVRMLYTLQQRERKTYSKSKLRIAREIGGCVRDSGGRLTLSLGVLW